MVVATLAFLVANRLLPSGTTLLGGQRYELEIWGFFIVWVATFAYAWLRPGRAWIDLCWIAAASAMTAVLLNALTTGDHLARSIAQGKWAVAGMDLVLLVGAVVAAVTARRLQRRKAATNPTNLVHRKRSDLMKTMLRFVIALTFCLGGSSAFAHHLWLEQTGQGVRLYFGEFGENLREASPGALDNCNRRPRLRQQQASDRLRSRRRRMALPCRARSTDRTASSPKMLRYPVFVRTKDGVTTRSIYLPAARIVPDRAARTPLLALDIVPGRRRRVQGGVRGQAARQDQGLGSDQCRLGA